MRLAYLLTKLVIVTAVFAALGAARTITPEDELPDSFLSSWWIDSLPITSFYLTAPANGNEDLILRARIGFNAEQQGVWVSVLYKEPTASPNYAVDERWHETSFIPTAVCMRSGIGRRFYVAGHSARTGVVAVEEWEFESVSPGMFQAQGSNEASLSVGYSIRREVIYSERAAEPVIDLACLPSSDELVFLVGREQRQLLKLDLLDPGSGPAPMPEGAGVSNLSEFSSLHYRVVTDGTPNGTFALLLLRPPTRWAEATDPRPARMLAYQRLHQFRDGDFDGAFELQSDATFGSLSNDPSVHRRMTGLYGENGELVP